MSLENKVAVVTGGSQGIGKALANKLAQEGAKSIYLIARTLQNLENTADEINSNVDRKCTHIKQGDITNISNMKGIIDSIYEKEGQIDIWINNAGLWFPQSQETDVEEIGEMMILVGIAPIQITHYLVQKTKNEDKPIHILNMNSQAGLWDTFGGILNENYGYGPGKSLLRSYLLFLEHDLSSEKNNQVTLSEIFPGTVATEEVKEAVREGGTFLQKPLPLDYVINVSCDVLNGKTSSRYVGLSYSEKSKAIEINYFEPQKDGALKKGVVTSRGFDMEKFMEEIKSS